MKILLTGGAGFIGSAVLVALLKRGDEVVVVDAFEETLYPRWRKEKNLEWARTFGEFEFHEVDIRDAASMSSLVAPELDAVIHLAAVAGVRPSIEKAPLYFDINVTATSLLLELGRKAGLQRFVLASSSSVYGNNTKVPFAETDDVSNPISPYAASKYALEVLSKTHVNLHGGHVSCLRFFTVYGPRQRPEMAMHKFMDLIAKGESVPMFGDGRTARDYTYIDDIVSGVIATLDRPDGFKVYNLGGDRVVHLDELIATIGRIVGREPVIQKLPMQPGDVPLTNADLTISSAELGYDPQTTLEAGLEAMWQWYQTFEVR